MRANWLKVLFASVATVGGIRAVRAQDARPFDAIAGPDGGAAFTDVYVNDSLEAADEIHKAETFAAGGRWADAAETLQRVMDNAGDKLIKSDTGQYISIRDHISRILSRWPAAGINEYRTLFEPRLREAMQAAGRQGSLLAMLGLLDRYFCTSEAARVADEVGQAAIEAGDLTLADRLYERVLDHHPDAASFEHRYRMKRALIAAMRGGDDAPPSADANATIRWKGQDRPLADVLLEIRADFDSLHADVSPEDWPIFGGNTERNRRTTTDVDELGLLWRFEDFGQSAPGSSTPLSELTEGESRDRSRLITIHPIVSGAFVYAQWGREVVALHRNTGALAWRFLADDKKVSPGGYLEEQPAAWESVTAHEGRVFVSLPGDAVSYYNYESNRNPADLVCLDAATGQVRWRLDQQAIAEQYAEVTFDSSPIVAHGGVLVIGRRRRSFGFEDCYLYRFDASSGALEWRTHLGSASTGTFGSRRPTRSIAAMHDGFVYVCSNLGTVAAVSAYTGGVRWLRIYDRDATQDGSGAGRYARDVSPWQFNPIIVSDNQLALLPMDANAILVYDLDAGGLLHTVSKDTLARPSTLLGLHRNLLCTAADRVACVDLLTDDVAWVQPLPDDAPLYGRAAWADDRLLVPTRRTLVSYRIADGATSSFDWDTEGEGGNLLVLPDQILVGGVGRISAYVRRQDIWKNLRARMASAPGDPLPALELAEVAMSNGEFSEALNVLAEAASRTESADPPADPTLTKRLFDDALMFVDRLAARSMLDVDALERLFLYASQYAPDTAGHVAYRLKFAALFEKLERPDRAMRLFHQILNDRTLRGLPVEPGRPMADPAGLFAQGQIADLIERHGRPLYEPYERQASQWLDSAVAAGDEAWLTRIVATFPNSETAARALVAQGDLLARRNRAEEAAKRFARAYHRYAKLVDRPALLKKIADAYESAGKPDYAYLWLTMALREYPSVRFDHEGRSIGFQTYRDRLEHVRRQVEASRPTLTVPLSKHTSTGLEESTRLLTPRFAHDPNARWAYYFIATNKGVQAYRATSPEPLWPQPADMHGKVSLLLTLDDSVIFATPYQIVAFDLASGAKRWTVGEYPNAIEREDADWEDADAFRTHALRQGRLVSLRDSGEMSCIELASGRVIWTQTHRPVSAGRLFFGDPWIVYHIVRDDQPAVCLIDAATGTWVDAIEVDENRVVEHAFLTLDGRIVVVTSQSIIAYDPDTHRRRWRTPVGGHVRGQSMMLDVDALYLSDDGHKVRKISLEDGRQLWESEELVPHRDDEMNAWLQGGNVLVASNSSVSAIDAVTGLTLWEGTTPDRCDFVARLLTDAYVVGVDVPAGLRGDNAHAYLYDHRNASGLIPDGGAPDLGQLRDIRAALAVDGALLIQTGTTLHTWTSP